MVAHKPREHPFRGGYAYGKGTGKTLGLASNCLLKRLLTIFVFCAEGKERRNFLFLIYWLSFLLFILLRRDINEACLQTIKKIEND